MKILAHSRPCPDLENSITRNDLYRIGEYFVDLYIRRNRKRKPKRIILDLDGTDDPTYGDQQLTFFHGYYDQYMYHPLVIYDADTGELITAALQSWEQACQLRSGIDPQADHSETEGGVSESRDYHSWGCWFCSS